VSNGVPGIGIHETDDFMDQVGIPWHAEDTFRKSDFP